MRLGAPESSLEEWQAPVLIDIYYNLIDILPKFRNY